MKSSDDIASGDGGGRLGELRAGIERSEARIAQTLEAIEKELSFDAVAKGAAENIKEVLSDHLEPAISRVGEAVKGASEEILESVKRNPAPAAIAGLGLGLLALGLLSRGKGAARVVPEGRTAKKGNGEPELVGQERARTRPRTEGAAFDAPDGISKPGDEWRAEHDTDSDDPPGANMVPLGLSVLAAGALAGCLLPMARSEKSLIRNWCSELADKAQETGGEMLRSAEAIVREVLASSGAGDGKPEGQPGPVAE